MLPRPPHFYSILYCRQVWVRRVLILVGFDSVRVVPAGEIVVLTPAAALRQILVRYASFITAVHHVELRWLPSQRLI
jgi:hypothetical protein